MAQARDADSARLSREVERNRVLEEALAALARTHHALEMSVAEELTKSKRKKKSKSSSTLNDSKENFFDVFEESEDEDDTLVTAGLSSPLGALSPWGSSPDLTRHTPLGSLDPLDGNKYNYMQISLNIISNNMKLDIGFEVTLSWYQTFCRLVN